MLENHGNDGIFSTKYKIFFKKYLTGCAVIGIMIKRISRSGLGLAMNFYSGRGLAAMKSTGIIRKVDDLGRIVLPIELRRMLDIAERDELEIYVENDRIVLQKYEPACIFCGSSHNLITYERKNVCQACVRKMMDQ